jgi:hypothetical protein
LLSIIGLQHTRRFFKPPPSANSAGESPDENPGPADGARRASLRSPVWRSTSADDDRVKGQNQRKWAWTDPFAPWRSDRPMTPSGSGMRPSWTTQSLGRIRKDFRPLIL